ncbi:MAG: hypothetical protein M1522_04730 [Actinobacteria bacterium]|nr:hypothetical protein [Actinomycetota bacterium]
MGSQFISEYVEKNEWITTPRAAFEYLQGRDRYERGHGGYTGSFAEVSGVVPLVDFEPQTLVAAERIAKQRDEAGLVLKWEHAEAIPVCKVTSERKVQVTRTVAGIADYRAEQAAAIGAVRLRPGEHVAAVVVQERQPARRKISVAATKGQAVTRYFVVMDDVFRMPTWSAGYATQSAARAALAEELRSEHSTRSCQDRSGEVVALTRREDGSGLVKGTSARVSQRCRFEVTIQTTTDEVGGWLIYAVASC